MKSAQRRYASALYVTLLPKAHMPGGNRTPQLTLAFRMLTRVLVLPKAIPV